MTDTLLPTPLGGGRVIGTAAPGVPTVREETAAQPGEPDRLLPGITVVIPTIPPRGHLLLRAINSVVGQSRPPEALAVAVDTRKEGAAVVRDRALWMVRTEWMAFLDDDDEMGRAHLQKLQHEAMRTGADLVFPWFTVVGGADPFPQHFGQVWNIGPDNLDEFRHIPITVLVKTRVMWAIGGFSPWAHNALDPTHANTNEDLGAFMEVARRGYSIVHLPERTWLWYHHGGNLSGRPTW
jgi:hypothetical protein